WAGPPRRASSKCDARSPAEQASGLVSPLLDGDVQRGLAIAGPRGAIRAVLEEQTDQREIAVECRLVKRRVTLRRAAAGDGGATRDREPADLGTAIGARPRRGGIDREVTFGILRDGANVGARIEERFGGLTVAEERGQVQGRPAVVGSLSHQ